MIEGEMLKLSVEEYSRLQDYMLSCGKDSNAYKKIKRRYIELKVILLSYSPSPNSSPPNRPQNRSEGFLISDMDILNFDSGHVNI